MNQKEVFRSLCNLCNAAMNRTIKGTENSLSSSSEMFSKHTSNLTGDLSNNVMNRGGGLLMIKSKEEYGVYEGHDTPQGYGDISEEIDFGDIEEEIPEPIKANTGIIGAGGAVLIKTNSSVRYSHIKTALVNSLPDLEEQVKNIEFRNLFRISAQESIISTEPSCQYYNKPTSSFLAGNLYLSQNFLNFAAVGSIAGANRTATSTAVSHLSGTSTLFDTDLDPALLFLIPYSHIVSLKKQAPSALTRISLSAGGYLVISTKNKGEFWMSFSGSKVRDGVYDRLLMRIKSVEWKFDDDLLGIAASSSHMSGIAAVSRASTSSLSLPSLAQDSNAPASPSQPIALDLQMRGLKFLNPLIERDGSAQLERYSQQNLNKWTEYFDLHGRDVCIVKDMKPLQDLIIYTSGLPDMYRGDFWMLVSGAWGDRPVHGYYEGLLVDNRNRKNPFEDEIEKDVRRCT